MQEAHVLIDGYSKHVASDATIAALDKNLFGPLAVQKTMTATLAALSKAISEPHAGPSERGFDTMDDQTVDDSTASDTSATTNASTTDNA